MSKIITTEVNERRHRVVMDVVEDLRTQEASATEAADHNKLPKP